MGVEWDAEAPFASNDEQGATETGRQEEASGLVAATANNNNLTSSDASPWATAPSEPNTTSQRVVSREEGNGDAWIVEQKKQAAGAPASTSADYSTAPTNNQKLSSSRVSLILVPPRTSADVVEDNSHKSIIDKEMHETKVKSTAARSDEAAGIHVSATVEANYDDGDGGHTAPHPPTITRQVRLERPQSQPGAYRIAGTASPSADESIDNNNLTPDPSSELFFSNKPDFDDEPTITLSAHPVDEALEAEKERRLGEQEGEIQEKEERIRELERQQKRRRKRFLMALLLVVLCVAGISVAVSLTVGGGDGKKETIIIGNNATQAPTLPQPWEQLGQSIPGENARDRFGMSVDLSRDGNFLAVGATENDGETNDMNDNRGHVRVFAYNRDISQWMQLGQDLDGDLGDDQFGKAVAVSGDSETGLVVAAGAPTLPDNDLPGRVKAFWYDTQRQQWVQWGDDLTGDIWYDDFGYAIALSANGTVLAVTCPGCEDETSVGQVRVFKYNGAFNMWEPMGQNINTNSSQINLYFGSSVTMSGEGTVLAVGAFGNNEKGYQAGSVRVFKFNGDTDEWGQLGQELFGDTDQDWFGYSVALASGGNVLAVGANGGNGYDKDGYVKVYRYRPIDDKWLQMGDSLSGDSPGGGFGVSVDLSDDGYTVVGGAYKSDSIRHNDTGRARVFRFNSNETNWYQIGLNIEGENDKDGAGRSVSVSGDGTRVAVSSPWHDDENGNHTGQVRVFDYVEF